MKYKLPLAALLLSLLCLAAAPPADDPPAVKHCVRKAVTVCDGDQTVGSGVVIRHNKKTYALTCAHVAEDFEQWATHVEPRAGSFVEGDIVEVLTRRRVTLKPYRGAKGSGFAVWVDKKRDVALVEILGKFCIDPVVIDPRAEVYPDDDVYYCGAGVKPFNLQRTWVACVLPDEGALGLGIGGWYGHSGSGVFKKRGSKFELVGMVQGLWEEGGRLVRAVDLKTILASLKDFDADAAIKARTQAD